MFNIFKKSRAQQKINIMPLSVSKEQKFISYWEPKHKIGKYIYFNYHTYTGQENGVSIYKWETKKVKVIGYEFTFTVDLTGNIQGNAKHKVAGNDSYYYQEEHETFEDETLAINQLKTL